MNKKEYIKSQKDCASMLGLSLKEYEESLKNIKCSKFSKNASKKNKVDNILSALGLSKKNLKKKAR